MKKKFYFLTVTFLLLGLFGCATAQAQDIGIKGLILGMDEAEFTKKFNEKVYSDGSAGVFNLTIAGTVGKGYISLKFDRNGKLGRLIFIFYPREFDLLKEVLNSKYKMTCETSVVSNAMGHQFDQEKCYFSNAKGDNLALTKLFKLDTSTLVLYSKALLKQMESEQNEKIKKGKEDI